MKIHFPKITLKMIKKLALRALALLLLLIPVCGLAWVVMFACMTAFVFIPLPIKEPYMMQIVFAATVLLFFILYAPDVCHWADKYV